MSAMIIVNVIKSFANRFVSGGEESKPEPSANPEPPTINDWEEGGERTRVRKELNEILSEDLQSSGANEAELKDWKFQVDAVEESLRDYIYMMPEAELDELKKLRSQIRKQIELRKEMMRAELELIKDPANAGKRQSQLNAKRKVVTDAIELGKLSDARTAILNLKAEIELVNFQIARDAQLKQYHKIADPPGISDEQVKRLETQRKLLLKSLPADSEIKNVTESTNVLAEANKLLEAAKGHFQKFVELIAEIKKEIDARKEHLQRVKATEENIKSSRATFPIASPNFLDTKLALAKSTGASAITVDEFAKANKLIDELDKSLVEVANYAKLYDETRELILMSGSTTFPVHVTSAQNLAKVGKFSEAVTELQKITNAPTSKDLVEYNQTLKSFWAATKGMRPAKAPLSKFVTDELTPAKASPTTTYANATAKIKLLLPKLVEMKAYVDRLAEVDRIQLKLALLPATEQVKVTNAIGAADTKAQAHNYVAAKTELDKLNTQTVLTQFVDYLSKLKAVNTKHEALQRIAASSSAAVYVKGKFDLAEADVTNEKYADAAKKLDTLAPIVTAALKYVELDRKVRDLCAALDPGLLTGLLKPATDLAVKNDYAGAVNLLTPLESKAQDIQAYFARKSEVDKLYDLLKPEQQAELDEVRNQAAEQVKADDYSSALATLEEIRQMSQFKESDAALGKFSKELATVEKKLTATLKLLDQAELKKYLNESLVAAKAEAAPGKDIEEGRKKLAALAKDLTAATGYTKERQSAKALVAFIDSAHSTAQSETPIRAVYTTAITQVAVKSLLTEGDEFGENHDFVSALAKYDDARALVKPLCQSLAQTLETAEGGHCLSAHGPQTTLTEQETRIKTGRRPDGANCETATATKFDNIEDFVATRQMAQETAKATDTQLAVGDPVTRTVFIEHGRPIDSCVIGLKPNAVRKQGGPRVGEAVEVMTFETFVTVKGLTRTRSVFKFKPDSLQNVPNKVLGKWVLHQQFPEADGWEPNETLTSGYYSTPLPGI